MTTPSARPAYVHLLFRSKGSKVIEPVASMSSSPLLSGPVSVGFSTPKSLQNRSDQDGQSSLVAHAGGLRTGGTSTREVCDALDHFLSSTPFLCLRLWCFGGHHAFPARSPAVVAVFYFFFRLLCTLILLEQTMQRWSSFKLISVSSVLSSSRYLHASGSATALSTPPPS